DNKVVDYLVSEFKKEQSIDLSKDKMAMQRLRDAAEKAKKELSGVSQTSISLPFISVGAAGPVHLEMNLTKAKFDELTYDLVQRSVCSIRQAIKDSKLSKD